MKKLSKVLMSIAMVVVACAQTSFAADYPDKPLRWIVPFPAGGGTDVVARAVADQMQPSFGQNFVIDNRPGASSSVAVTLLLQAKADGYTILHGENSSLIWNQHLYKKLSYNPETDFT